MKVLSSRFSRKLTSTAIVAVAGVVTPAIADNWGCIDNCQTRAKSESDTVRNSAFQGRMALCQYASPAYSVCINDAISFANNQASDKFNSVMTSCANACYASV